MNVARETTKWNGSSSNTISLSVSVRGNAGSPYVTFRIGSNWFKTCEAANAKSRPEGCHDVVWWPQEPRS